MARSEPRLPGMGRGRKRTGRHRRALDAYARAVRNLPTPTSPSWEHLLVIVRGHADNVDRAEDDPDVSDYTVATALSQYRASSLDLYRHAPLDLSRDALDALDDDLDAYLDGSAAALRDASTS